MSDKDYIRQWKAAVMQSLPSYSAEGWTQRDLERLAELIAEKSGVTISLSTLKRIWKEQFVKLPHPTTLDALVSVLDHDSWHDFVASLQSTGKPNAKPSPRKKLLIPVGALVFLTVIVLLNSLSLNSKEAPIRIEGPILFESDKSVSAGVPNTVMFNFDLQHVVADSFFIQQSWNELIRTRVNPEDHYSASVYYLPGFHRAKLIADDSIIATTRIHLITDDWFPYMRWDYSTPVPIYLDQTRQDGKLGISIEDARRKMREADQNHTFALSKFQDFEGISSNNFRLQAKLRTRELQDVACPWLEMRLILEEHIFYVPLVIPGCVGDIRLKIGEQVISGGTHDLSALGAQVFDWQELSLEVKDKHASITLNGKEAYQLQFEEEFGDIMGLVFRFSGPGELEEVSLQDFQGRSFHDHFEGPSSLLTGRTRTP